MAAKKRLPFPDIVRGFAIILVVLGHCIQMGSGTAFYTTSAFYDDRLYQWIYTFHMPLFMLISGYFAALSLRKAESTAPLQAPTDSVAAESRHNNGQNIGRLTRIPFRLLGRRTLQMLIPIAFWTIFEIVVAFVRTYVQIPADDPVRQEKIIGLVKIELSDIPGHFVNELWFLWAILWSFLAVFVIRYLFHNAAWAMIVLELAMFVTPDALNFGVYKYVFSFYLVGYLCAAKESWVIHYRKIKDRTAGRWLPVILSGLIFGVLFIFYNKGIMIYLSGYRIVFDIVRGGTTAGSRLRAMAVPVAKDIYRFVIGMAGCCFVMLLLRQLFHCCDREYKSVAARGLCALGSQTMGIYIVSGYYIIFGVSAVCANVQPSHWQNLLETVIVVALSFITSALIAKVPGLRKVVGK